MIRRVILWAGECPLTESRKGTRYRCDSDVTENFPAFYPLPTQFVPHLAETVTVAAFLAPSEICCQAQSLTRPVKLPGRGPVDACFSPC